MACNKLILYNSYRVKNCYLFVIDSDNTVVYLAETHVVTLATSTFCESAQER